MDLILMGNTQIIILDMNDCNKISMIGYKYFDIIFSPLDWKIINDLPKDGLFFFHKTPDVYLLLLYACKPEWSQDERIGSVGMYYHKILDTMVLDRIPFPRLDTKESIFD